MTDTADTLIKIVNTLQEIEKDYEIAKGFWDAQGLALYLAVKRNGSVGISTKHWTDVVYLETQNSSPHELWLILGKVTDAIGRTMVRAERGSFVYIPNLNEEQTEEVYNKIVTELQSQKIIFDENLKMEWEWEVDDAVLFRTQSASSTEQPEEEKGDTGDSEKNENQ